ncbi:hypothetical protein [Aureispira anguillae]|uniref:Lipoprotein n=1 Tax=Aureispira anguillae TaxID=2864201 RepID=A0A916DU21_9BACT|nr:hypothetical protein [Aureispira anguillae]BDS13764.1 hypothetical protein AsAng_0045260 [Aureispira anguillae]
MKKIIGSTQQVHWLGLIVTFLFLTSCGGPSASKYAQKLCDCSEAFSKAAIQLRSGTINQATFDQIKKEHDACMGEDNPLEKLADDPEALVQFKAEFLIELEKSCPEVARNMGY